MRLDWHCILLLLVALLVVVGLPTEAKTRKRAHRTRPPAAPGSTDPRVQPLSPLESAWGNVDDPDWDPWAELRKRVVLRPIERRIFDSQDAKAAKAAKDAESDADGDADAQTAYFGQIGLERVPVIVEASPVTGQWAAFSRWSPEYLASHVPGSSIEEVRVSHGGPIFRYYNDLRPGVSFQDMPGVVSTHLDRAYDLETVDKDAFFACVHPRHAGAADAADAGPGSDGSLCDESTWAYYGAALRRLGPRVVADTSPVDQFVERNSTFSLADAAEYRKTQAWIGRNGTVTPLHYDAGQNFHIMVVGTKRVVLFPPSAWSKLGLYPHLHPRAKQSPTELYWDAPDPTMYLRPGLDTVVGFEAELRPGDVLSIPPYWGHTLVTTSSAVVSVNVWTVYGELHLLSELMAVPVPAPRAPTSSPASVLSLRLFIRLLVSVVLDTADGHTFFIALFNERYAAHMHELVPEGRQGESRVERSFCEAYLSDMSSAACAAEWVRPSDPTDTCENLDDLSAGALFHALRSPFIDAAQRMRDVLAAGVAPESVTSSSGRLVLGNLVEMLTLTAVDGNVFDVALFLRDLVEC